MTEHVSKSRFKAKALEYFRRVEASGEPIVITERGKPTLELRRVQAERSGPSETLKGSVLWYDDPFASAVDEADWESLG